MGRLLQPKIEAEIADHCHPVRPTGAHAAPEATTVPTHQVSVFLEVEGAAHYLPAHAGNLDIMTSAAVLMAERIAQEKHADR